MLSFQVQEILLRFQFFAGLFIVFIGHTAIHGAHFCTLGLIVEAYTFCALIGNDVEDIVIDGFLGIVRVIFPTTGGLYFTFEIRSVGEAPFFGALIYRVIGAFGFAGPAVNAFVSYLDRHKSTYFCGQNYEKSAYAQFERANRSLGYLRKIYVPAP